jgi:hypothetical protein
MVDGLITIWTNLHVLTSVVVIRVRAAGAAAVVEVAGAVCGAVVGCVAAVVGDESGVGVCYCRLVLCLVRCLLCHGQPHFRWVRVLLVLCSQQLPGLALVLLQVV